MTAMELPGIEAESMHRSAEISGNGRYRYALRRRWSPALGTVCWVMLNPSVADDQVDDPTLTRCIGFTKREGYGALTVVNLFALRATHPAELRRAGYAYAVGPDNTSAVHYQAAIANLVIVAWGAERLARKRAQRVTSQLRSMGIELHRLGQPTKAGYPGHPLYMPADTPLERHW